MPGVTKQGRQFMQFVKQNETKISSLIALELSNYSNLSEKNHVDGLSTSCWHSEFLMCTAHACPITLAHTHTHTHTQHRN